MTDTPRGTAFTTVDHTPADLRTAMIAYLDGAAAHPAIQELREVELDMLGVRTGARVLDAGCGLGEVARTLAALVGPSGSVDAVDSSQVLLEQAEQRLRERPLPPGSGRLRYAHGDVNRLDAADESFDVVRCERVLQHLADPDAAIAELLRVTRPGGRVSLVDTDWESLTVDGVPADLFERLMARMSREATAAGASMGRTLRGRLLDAGVSEVTCRPVTACFIGIAGARGVLGFVDIDQLGQMLASLPTGSTAEDEELVEHWGKAVRAADTAGRLLFALTFWVAIGVR